jgi:N-methylhydantoinase A
MAETMDIRRICVPVYPGLFSALGLLLADFSQEYVRGVALRLDGADADMLFAQYDCMEHQAARELGSEEAGGAIFFKRQVTVKYGFQASAMTLTIPGDLSSADFQRRVAALFTEAYQTEFGHSANDAVELVSIRLRATKKVSDVSFSDLAHESRTSSVPTTSSERPAYFGAHHGTVKTTLASRREVNTRIDGPLIVEEPDATIVVPPGWSIEKDAHENLWLER